jgi:imidazolonepropionase-like amidohydrolase
MAGSLRTIQAGQLADLLIVNRDPLEDVSALRDIASVFKGGMIVWP